jgi:peptide/nickel transport system ATP-binding protein
LAENIIEVRNLSVEFPLSSGTVHAVNNVDFDVPKGKITALVGESGSGKSTMAMTMLNVVSSPGVIREGSIYYKGKDVLKYNKREIIKYKWKEVSMVFQAAQNALNPVMLIKDQIIETAKAHEAKSKENDIIKKASELLDFVRLEPKRILNSYPHELSGGMKQRVMIAFSLLLDPKLVILDEPTTALDVITQDYIFDILMKVHKEIGTTMLLLTHDIGIVAKAADRIGVMYAGEVVEVGDVYTMFKEATHPYTVNLMNAAPSLIDDLKDKKPIIGSTPNLLIKPKICSFITRCDSAMDICKSIKPKLLDAESEHLVACHLCNKAVV